MDRLSENVTVTLTRNDWIEVRAALVECASSDRNAGRNDVADEIMRLRDSIVSQMRAQD